jgi:small subunit ribosomal protein S17
MTRIRYGGRKTRVGVVVRDKMAKTVVVAVEAFKRHRLYKKIMRRVKRYKAHDEENACQVGDKVLIVETRPLSRDKRWRVAEILATAALPEEERAFIDEEVAEELRELEEVMVAEAPPAEEEELPAVAEEVEEAPPAGEAEQPPSEEEVPAAEEVAEEELPAAAEEVEEAPPAGEAEQPPPSEEEVPAAEETVAEVELPAVAEETEEAPPTGEAQQPPPEEEQSQAGEEEQPQKEEPQES